MNGYACAFDTFHGYGAAGRTVNSAVYASVGVITTASSGDEIKVAGATILVRLSFSMKNNTAVDTTMAIRVRDTTAATTVWERSAIGTGDTAGYLVTTSAGLAWVPGPYVEFRVAVPAIGTRQYTVEMSCPTGNPYRVRDLTVAFVGTVA